VRERTGEGIALETSLFDALAEWMSYAAYFTSGGSSPSRTGASHATIAPYGPVQSADNKVVYLGLQNEREWKKFCDVFCRLRSFPQTLALTPMQASSESSTARSSHAKCFPETDRSRNHSAARSSANRECQDEHRSGICGPSATRSQNALENCGFAVGKLRALLPPVTMEHVDTAMNEIPALGQHTDAILGELGFDSETIAGWRQSTVI